MRQLFFDHNYNFFDFLGNMLFRILQEDGVIFNCFNYKVEWYRVDWYRIDWYRVDWYEGKNSIGYISTR